MQTTKSSLQKPLSKTSWEKSVTVGALGAVRMPIVVPFRHPWYPTSVFQGGAKKQRNTGQDKKTRGMYVELTPLTGNLHTIWPISEIHTPHGYAGISAVQQRRDQRGGGVAPKEKGTKHEKREKALNNSAALSALSPRPLLFSTDRRTDGWM